MEITRDVDPQLLTVRDRMFIALAPVLKNFEPPMHASGKNSSPRQINELDLGSLLHRIVGVASEKRFKTVDSVMESLSMSDRWVEAYGKNKKKVAQEAVKVGLDLLSQIEEQEPGQVLISELRFLASEKARGKSLAETIKDPRRARRALWGKRVPLVPQTVDIVPANQTADQKKKILSYGIQAIPDLIGFTPKTEEAKMTLRKLLKVIYQDNEGKKRFMLDPQLLAEYQPVFKEVMDQMMQGNMKLSVTEIKTSSWVKKSLVEQDDAAVTQKYSDDIGHTLLVLLSVFKTVDTQAFKGARKQETMDKLLEATTVHLGLVDFPSLYVPWGRRMGHMVPRQAESRLVTLTSDQIKKSCIDRMEANQKYCIRHKLTPIL